MKFIICTHRIWSSAFNRSVTPFIVFICSGQVAQHLLRLPVYFLQMTVQRPAQQHPGVNSIPVLAEKCPAQHPVFPKLRALRHGQIGNQVIPLHRIRQFHIRCSFRCVLVESYDTRKRLPAQMCEFSVFFFFLQSSDGFAHFTKDHFEISLAAEPRTEMTSTVLKSKRWLKSSRSKYCLGSYPARRGP